MQDDGDNDTVLFFRRELLNWWQREGRAFPWRETRDPYHVLIAELMLRRTRADQVVPVYSEFLWRYPTVFALASATPGELEALLYPLGLAWRMPAFRSVADVLLTRHGGVVPSEREALLSLPGVGDYVADAILSFAFDVPVAVVDTNTVRVAGRYLGFPIGGEARRRKTVISNVGHLIGRDQARSMNLAVLDLGSLVCRSRSPRCGICPVRRKCTYSAFAHDELSKSD
jgi:A/G-specific adenine glycosylase